MRKVALVLVLAVFLPSLVLAWLAVRTLRDEQFVLERQQTLLCQSIADRVAQQASELVATHQREFAREVETLLADRTPAQVASTFDDDIRSHWPLAEVGFAVSLEGRMLAPSLTGRAECRQFRLENDKFLCNAEAVEVSWNNPKLANNAVANNFIADGQQSADLSLENNAYKLQQFKRRVTPLNYDSQSLQTPAQQIALPDSKTTFAEAEFHQLIGNDIEGTMARFLQNKLNVMTWYRPPREPQVVFGARLNLARLTADLRRLVSDLGGEVQGEICLAILDDTIRPVASSHADFKADWRRPFVAAEIGDALPHWEIAAYLIDPNKLTRTAANLRFTLGVLVTALVLAIGVGGWLVVRELQREMTLARQKTDFVSNVSHELKTPLTSIRMFSELLADDRVKDEEKRRSYLAIITAETARLTRLINNFLDFSRLERGEKKYDFRPCDLAEVAREAAHNFRPQLESSGFQFDCELPTEPLLVSGDRDALAQIVLNLLSNAEKYSCNGTKEITLQLRREDRPIPHVELRVLDRGSGVPKGSEEKIFEKFYRAHDSLASGIQGSGLGLTLARQIARAHGGDMVYEPREGGGSAFALRLPTKAGEHR